MTVSWPMVQLAQAAQSVSTGPFGSLLHKSDYVSGGIPLVNPANIEAGQITADLEKTIDEIAAQRLSPYRLRVGDVVIGRRGEIGRCAVVTDIERGWLCGTGSFFIRPGSSLDPYFLAYLLRSPVYRDQLESASTGATMKNLSNKALSQLAIPLPPLAEQKRIVAILDATFEGIDTAIANAEQNLANARALFASRRSQRLFRQNVDWIEMAFEATVERLSAPARIKRKEYKSEGRYPIVSQEAEFINGRWDRAEDLVRLNGPVVVWGDHTRVTKYVDFDFVAGADGLKIFDPRSVVNARFLFHWLDALPVKTLGYARHYRILKECSIRMPSDIARQWSIVNELDELSSETERLADTYNRKLEALKALRRSFLSVAFKGELKSDGITSQAAE